MDSASFKDPDLRALWARCTTLRAGLGDAKPDEELEELESASHTMSASPARFMGWMRANVVPVGVLAADGVGEAGIASYHQDVVAAVHGLAPIVNDVQAAGVLLPLIALMIGGSLAAIRHGQRAVREFRNIDRHSILRRAWRIQLWATRMDGFGDVISPKIRSKQIADREKELEYLERTASDIKGE